LTERPPKLEDEKENRIFKNDGELLTKMTSTLTLMTTALTTAILAKSL
jgi:hypothetical protein